MKWTKELEEAFHKTKKMVQTETLLTYPDWMIPFTIHTDASDDQLGAVISQNNKPIAFFSRKLSMAQCNYATTEKELLAIIECLKQFCGILFDYPIDVWSDHKNLVYAATLSESQWVMQWRLILEEFGHNIQHIAGVDNKVADALSRLPWANTDREDDSTESLCQTNKLFMTNGEATDDSFPLKLSTVLREQNIELNKRDSKLSKDLEDKDSGYNKQVLNDVEIIFYKNKIYVPQCLRRLTLDWYHFHLNHPGGDRLAKTLTEVCYWKGLANQAKQHAKRCKICQTFKKLSKRYGKLPPKDVGQLTPWHTVHVDLIGPYTKAVKQIQPGGTVTEVELYLTCMTFIDLAIAQVPYYDLHQIKVQNQEYIDKASARISQHVAITKIPMSKTSCL